MTDLQPHHITTFEDTVYHVAQRQGSVLLPYVDFQTGYTGEKVSPVKTYGKTKARVGAARTAATPIMSTARDRRWLSPTQVDWGDIVDPQDIINQGADPTSPLVQAAGMAMGRALDEDIIMPAYFAGARTGKDGATTTAHDTANDIAVTFDGAAGSSGNLGLTATKLARAKRILKGNDERPDMPGDQLCIAYPADQHERLMQDVYVSTQTWGGSERFNRDDPDGFLGYKFIPLEAFSAETDGDLHLPIWMKSGMHVGDFGQALTRITERNDLSHATQIYTKRFWGCTRLQESKVVRVKCEPYAL